ncbi:MAG: HD domain-containing protein [Nocardioides sp.]
MQPMREDDPRSPYIQIAASIRAAILAGELQPEAQLPSGDQLATFFGVTRTTVASAIRILKGEGFVTSRPGGGVYVTGQATMPMADGDTHELSGLGAFLHEAGQLKNLPRAGWLLLGIRQPESVAEHSHRVSLIGTVLATLEGADAGRTAILCLMHDLHETRIGDVDAVGRAYVGTATPQAVTTHQTAGLPTALAETLQEVTAEYEEAETLEAKVARDADKLETLLQAKEYAAQGYATEAWQNNAIYALRTDSAKELAQALSASDLHEWWTSFDASYHELRATTRASRGMKPLSS